MSDIEDAEARRRIEQDLDTTFIVEAAAGTGKTTSLVRRVLATVGAGVDIANIVAVTFTDKAAGELKWRIRAGLERRKSESTDELRRRFDRALAGLEEARVSTIHRFAGDLLRLRPVEAGVDPLFSPLSATESRALFDEAFGHWLEGALAKPSTALRRALARHNGSVERLRYSAMRLMEHRHLDAEWTRKPVDVVAEAKVVVAAVQDVAARSERPRYRTDKLFVALAPFRDLARRASGLDDEALEGELVALASAPFPDRLGSGQYGAGVDRAALIADVEAARAALAAFMRQANAHLAVELRDDLLGPVRSYDELKRKRGALDFDDLLLRARDVLIRDPRLLANVRERLTHFFIDEFQDTDPVQAQLLLLLAAEDGQPPIPFESRVAAGRLFVVGDPKQSIYRFRHADPGTYELVRKLVVDGGGEVLELGVSFRSVPGIVSFVNSAFERVIERDPVSQQAHYVPLRPSRVDDCNPSEPPVVGLPISRPYRRRLGKGAIRASLPEDLAAFIVWLLEDSGRTVVDPTTKERVPIAARHVAVLFRQFAGSRGISTEPLSLALTSRGIPHAVVGASLLGGRDEGHAIIVALRAVEMPDDDLLVYATLRGLLFGLSDETLFEWIERYGGPSASRLPKTAIPAHLQGVLEALLVLVDLHRMRNVRTPAETLAKLLELTQASIGFALAPSAEHAFLQVAAIEQIAAAHEHNGGLSYASFVAALDALENERASAVEDASDDERGGVRIMTVHRAKGLEFPVVVLADPAEGSVREPDKFVDVGKNLGALSLMSCAPWDLVDAHPIELARAAAEGARLAYVAATRARDLLVVPVVGDDPAFPADGWLAPLTRALAPTGHADGPDLVLNRPDDVERPIRSIGAGVHETAGGPVAFVDPKVMATPSKSALGIREVDLLSKDADATVVEADNRAWREARAARQTSIERSARAPRISQTVTKRAKAAAPAGAAPSLTREIGLDKVARAAGRPTGKRFGTLVHLVLATVPLDADKDVVLAVARSVARLTGAQPGEPEAAAQAVSQALAHPIFERARASSRVQREVPVTLKLDDANMADGIVDLAFQEGETTIVVDYKTDDPERVLPEHLDGYRAQVDLYARAIEKATGRLASGSLLFV